MNNQAERCPKTDRLVHECAHCRAQATRAEARYVITVGLRKRGASQARTIHDPDCWHATKDTEPPDADWDAIGEANDGIFVIPPEVLHQDEEHHAWAATGRLRRRTVTRGELRPGPGGTVVFEDDSYKRCQRCAPSIW